MSISPKLAKFPSPESKILQMRSFKSESFSYKILKKECNVENRFAAGSNLFQNVLHICL